MSDGEVVNEGRRRFLTAATSVVGAAGVVGVAVPFVGSWNPSAKAKAAGAPITVNLAKIQPGAMITEEWRGKPVYIIRRTEEALANLDKMTDKLSDPDSVKSSQPSYVLDNPQARARKPEYMIMLGVCTHLGCAPKYRPEVGAADLGGESWLGGFFCPCHGSKFDLSGRVFKKVPAPLNLPIPPYKYESESVVVIGVDEESA